MLLGIHGAFSSPNSLNYIKEHLSDHEWKMVNYSDSIRGIENIIKTVNSQITKPTVVIGHSLGGIIGINLLKNPNVKKVITISSPINGLWFGFMVQMILARQTFITELKPSGTVIRTAKSLVDAHPDKITSIVTTKGLSPYIMEDNDGVLTVASQDYGNQNKYFIPANHHEILQIDRTVQIIKLTLDE